MWAPGPTGEACDDEVFSPSGHRCCGGGDPAGGCGGRNVGSELGGVRHQLVAQCLDQRVQTAPGTAGVVDTPAGVRAAVRPVGRAAATSPAAVGAAAPPDMGWRQSAVGLDRDLTASVGSTRASQRANTAQRLRERVTGGQAPAKTRLQRAQVEQDRVAQPVVAPVCDLVDDLVGCALQARIFE